MFPVTALYAALLALLLLLLARSTILRRQTARILLGDGADEPLQRRIRAHANFAEYAPLGLILLALCEAQGAPPLVLHALGLMLLIGRVLHAWGLIWDPSDMRRRVGGMALTLTMIGLAALGLLGHGLWRMLAG